MPGVSRIGDEGSHGGTISTGSSTSMADGTFVCRNTDIYDCDIHGPNPIECSSSVTVDGLAIAFIGAMTSCGASIVTGSSTVFADN
jgi:uncharacterized Zn-binding protein involved in type VI secretion